jgi:hypothetical protein
MEHVTRDIGEQPDEESEHEGRVQEPLTGSIAAQVRGVLLQPSQAAWIVQQPSHLVVVG